MNTDFITKIIKESTLSKPDETSAVGVTESQPAERGSNAETGAAPIADTTANHIEPLENAPEETPEQKPADANALQPEAPVESAPTARASSGTRRRRRRRGSRRTNDENVERQIAGKVSEELLSTEKGSRKALNEKEKKQARVFAELEKEQKEKTILRARIRGVEMVNGRPFCYLNYNGVRIRIPDFVFFEPSYDFGEEYKKQSQTHQRYIRMARMRRYINAIIPFVVSGFFREKDEDGSSHIEYAIGDRTTAMDLLRRFYFRGEDVPCLKDIERPKIEVGTKLYAHVLCVDVNRITVECCGVETRMDTFGSTYASVDSCHEVFSPGDTLGVTVHKAFYLVNGEKRATDEAGEGTIYLGLTTRLAEVTDEIAKMSINSAYVGKVDSYNPKKKTYSIILDNGVLANVHESNVRGGFLFDNDEVQVVVTVIAPTFVLGKAYKI